MSKVKVRNAPSPTGKLHIGNVHTFLFNYCFARSLNGEVMLRIEDTDQARNKIEFVEDIKDALSWLGLTWDGEPEFQSKRQANYLDYAQKLLNSGDAYHCYHSAEELEAERKSQESKGQAPRYSGACRNLSSEEIKKYESQGRVPAIRFRMTGSSRPKEIRYQDLVYGEIKYNPEDIGDFVIVRSDRSILYNFANVLDDNFDKITHVIRGQSHLTNTPRQLLIYAALGFEIPRFGHLPEILNPDRVGKLSKRYGAVSVTEFRDKGYLPQAMINFLGSLGWSHPEGKEFFTLEDMVKSFSFDRVSKSPAALDLEKLDFLNSHYLREESNQGELNKKLKDMFGDKSDQVKQLLLERISKISDVEELAGYLVNEPPKPKFKSADYNKVLSIAALSAEKIDPWAKDIIERELRLVQEKSGINPKDFFVTIGQAISGSDVFLPLFDSLEILGREKTLDRLKRS